MAEPTLEEIMKKDGAVDNNPTSETESDGLSFGKLEVGGIITDARGNSWQVPADNVEDKDDLYAADFYSNVPAELSGVFKLVGVPTKEVSKWTARQFVPVFKSELGITEELRRFAGDSTDSIHTVGDMTIMKIPHVLYDRRQAKKHKETKRRLDTVEPTAEMIENAKKNPGVMTRVERSISQSGGPQERLGGDD